MPDHITVENAPSLAINGGFEEETPLGEDPIGWVFDNVSFYTPRVDAGSVCPVDKTLLLDEDVVRNSWYREVSPQRQPGYRSFLNMTVAAGTIEARIDLSNVLGSFDPYYMGQKRYPPYTTVGNVDPLHAVSFDDIDYTLTFSIEVLRGMGRIEVYQAWWDQAAQTLQRLNDAGQDATTAGYDLLVTNLRESSWQRLTFNGRFGWKTAGTRYLHYLLGPTLRFTKQSHDAFVFRFSACGVYRGHYSEVPYGGDLSRLMIPPGTVCITYGDTCPPGFREAELESNFLKITSANDIGTTGGSETHTHEMPVKAVDLAKTSGFQDQAKRDITRASDHSHPVGDGISIPSARRVGVCVRY